MRISTIEIAATGNSNVVKRGQYVDAQLVRSRLDQAMQNASRIESDAETNAASIIEEAVSSTDGLLARRLSEVLGELDRQIAAAEQRLLEAVGEAVVSHIEETVEQKSLDQFVAYVVRHVRARLDDTSAVRVSVSPYDYPEGHFEPVGMSNLTEVRLDPELSPGNVRIQIGAIVLKVDKAALVDYLAQRCSSVGHA